MKADSTLLTVLLVATVESLTATGFSVPETSKLHALWGTLYSSNSTASIAGTAMTMDGIYTVGTYKSNLTIDQVIGPDSDFEEGLQGGSTYGGFASFSNALDSGEPTWILNLENLLPISISVARGGSDAVIVGECASANPNIQGTVIDCTSPTLGAFVLKLDDKGTLQWAVPFGASGALNVHGVSMDAEGDVYMAGSFVGNFIFGGAGDSNQKLDLDADVQNGFFVKLNATGTAIWGHIAEGHNPVALTGVEVVNGDSVVLIGDFEDWVVVTREATEFNPSQINISYTGITNAEPTANSWAMKINATTGYVIWTCALSDNGPAYASSLAVAFDYDAIYVGLAQPSDSNSAVYVVRIEHRKGTVLSELSLATTRSLYNYGDDEDGRYSHNDAVVGLAVGGDAVYVAVHVVEGMTIESTSYSAGEPASPDVLFLKINADTDELEEAFYLGSSHTVDRCKGGLHHDDRDYSVILGCDFSPFESGFHGVHVMNETIDVVKPSAALLKLSGFRPPPSPSFPPLPSSPSSPSFPPRPPPS